MGQPPGYAGGDLTKGKREKGKGKREKGKILVERARKGKSFFWVQKSSFPFSLKTFPYFLLSPFHCTRYKSWRRSLRFCTVPLLRAMINVSGRKSAKATISTLGVVSAAMPSRAKGKSQGVRIQLCAY